MGPFPVGTLVYVQTAAGWEVAQVLAAYDDRVEVLLHGVPQVHPLVHVRVACPAARLGVPDTLGASGLEAVHEASLVDVLRVRHARGEAFTWCSRRLLLALRPSTHASQRPHDTPPPLPPPPPPHGLLQCALAEATTAAAARDVVRAPVHVAHVAHAAMAALIGQRKSQAVVVSGDRGAGKTTAARDVVRCAMMQHGASGGGAARLQQRVRAAQVVLDAFVGAAGSTRAGVATTLMFVVHPPSSDGGGSEASLVGAEVTLFAAERARVAAPPPGEHNMDVFYQLCGGACAHEMAALGLLPAENFFYLAQHAADSSPSPSAASAPAAAAASSTEPQQALGELKHALTTLDVSPAETDGIFQVLAAILHLGNLCFEDGRGGNAELLTPQTLAVAAALLRVPLAALASAVLYHAPTAAGQRRRARDAAGAVAAADALAGGLYAALLRRLTTKLNEALRPPSAAVSTSSAFTVVESPAFQSVSKNSLEQLCSNYAHEWVHCRVLEALAEAEASTLAEEGLWSPADAAAAAAPAVRSRRTLRALDAVFAALEEAEWSAAAANRAVTGGGSGVDTSHVAFATRVEAALQREGCATEPTTVSAICTSTAASPSVSPCPSSSTSTSTSTSTSAAADTFSVLHTAGRVACYHATGCVAQNSAAAAAQLQQVVRTSTSHAVRALLFRDAQAATPTAAAAGAEVSSRTAALRAELWRLKRRIDGVMLHWVHCVDPQPADGAQGAGVAETAAKGTMDSAAVSRQLRAADVVQLALLWQRIGTEYYTFQATYQQLHAWYAGEATATSLVQSKAFVQSLLQRLAAQGGGGTGWYTAGRSVLFMRSPRLLQLLHDRQHAASTLQRWYRRVLRRRQWSPSLDLPHPQRPMAERARRGEGGPVECGRWSGNVGAQRQEMATHERTMLQTMARKKQVELAAADARAMMERAQRSSGGIGAKQHVAEALQRQDALSEYTRALESQLEGVQRAVGMDLTDADVRVEFWKSEARAARITANVLLSTAVESMTVKLHKRAAELSNPHVA